MTWTMKSAAAAALVLVLVAGCAGDKKSADAGADSAQNPNPAPTSEGSLAGVVTETMNAGGYTYVQVKTGDEMIWAASSEFPVEVGDRVVVPTEMPMRGFRSEALDRDFEVIYFATAILNEGDAQAGGTMLPPGHPGLSASDDPHGKPVVPPSDLDFSGLKKAEGGYSIEEVYARSGKLEGQEVAVRGKVVKFNSGIMGTNWVHVQDGTGDPGSNDLTVTTDAVVEVGNTVLVRGVVSLDKDFGAGYTYSVIVEKADVVVE